MDDRFDHLAEGVLTLDGSGMIVDASAPAARLLGRERSGLIGTNVEDAFPDTARPAIASTENWLDGEIEFVEFFPSLDRWLEVRTAATEHGVTAYIGDVTDRERRRQEFEAREAEVDTLAEINETISDVLATLVRASSREEIEETVCDRLGDSDLYRFAWIGERVVGDEVIEIRASAGDPGDVLERIRDGYGGDPPSPEQRALETGAVHSVTGLAEDSTVSESIRQAAFARGLHSCLAVPLTYGSTVYGVLGMYTDRQDTLTERERESFEVLGRMVGFAINAARQRNLVLSDTVIELTYRIADRSSPLIEASAELEATLVVEGIVPVGDGELIAYVSIDGASVPALAEAIGTEMDTRTVRGDELVEISLSGSTLLTLLADLGATIRAAEYDDGTGEVVVEVSPQEDLQSIDRELTDAFDDIQLLAKRERGRSVESAGEFRRALRDRLTDRQHTVLRTAYLADYFESPHGSTSEEIAGALDITGPTLLHHLRIAERKLLDAFFEDLDPANHRLESMKRNADR